MNFVRKLSLGLLGLASLVGVSSLLAAPELNPAPSFHNVNTSAALFFKLSGAGSGVTIPVNATETVNIAAIQADGVTIYSVQNPGPLATVFDAIGFNYGKASTTDAGLVSKVVDVSYESGLPVASVTWTITATYSPGTTSGSLGTITYKLTAN